MLGLPGMTTRRFFVYIPRKGSPVAVTHAIEQGPWLDWPREWGKIVYSSWASLDESLRRTVGGKRVAMEYSPGEYSIAIRFPLTSLPIVDSRARQLLYFSFVHLEGHAVHGPCSIACVTATGDPLRGI